MGDFLYRPVTIEPGQVPPWVINPVGPDPRGIALGAGAKLLQQAVVLFGRIGLAYRVQREVERIERQLADTLSAHEGVLIRVTTQTWVHSGHGTPAPEVFVEAAVATRAPNPTLAVQKWRSRPRLLKGPPAGWKFVDRFLWLEHTRPH